MKIWLIQTGETLPLFEGTRKMRTGILADRLADKGHQVLWWTSAFDHFRKEWVSENDSTISLGRGIDAVLLKGRGYKKNISLQRFIDHRIVASKFSKKAEEYQKPDVMVVSTPPHDLAFEAVKFAKEKDIPTIKTKVEEIEKIAQKAATELYQKAAADKQAQQQAPKEEGKKDEKVVDAEVVDEEKKKDE